MNNTLLRDILIRHEGVQHCVYLDTLGCKTAGIGHLLIGIDRDREVGSPIDQKTVDRWFDADIERSIWIAKSLVPDLSSIDDVRQVVIVDLTFNLGNRFANFHDTLEAINCRNWTRAADKLQKSKWFTQVGRRGPENCFAMREGFFGFM